MKKKKHWIIGSVVTLLLVSGIAYGIYVYQHTGIKITVVNKTDKPIHGVELQLSPGVPFRTLPEVAAGERIEEMVDPRDSDVEMYEQVWIVHKRTSGSEGAFGYIETTYRGEIEVVIHKLEENTREVEMTKLGVKIW